MKVISSLILGLFVSFSAMAELPSDDNPLPVAHNLQALGQEALKKNIPVAILFAAKGLRSTERLKDEAILPALHSGQLDGYVLMTEIHVNEENSIIDFYGDEMPVADFKDLYNLSSLPVVIFVNGEGEVIHEQLLSGAYDFYFHFLKQFINESLQSLNNPKQIP